MTNALPTAPVDLTVPMVYEDLEPVMVPVTLGKKNYMLVEADEDVSVKFQNSRLSAARFSDGKLSSVNGAADVEPLLVQGCLYEVTSTNKETGKPLLGKVSMGFVRSLKASIVKDLYNRALKISDLDKLDKEADTATEAGSDSNPKEQPESTSGTSS